MSYCGRCNTHNVTFTIYEEGIECSNCGFTYNEDEEKDCALQSLRAIKHAKRDGWKIYPNWPEFGEPIDKVLKEAEERCKKLGLSI
jgi:hypothetical protein